MQNKILEIAIKSFVQELIKKSVHWVNLGGDEVKQLYKNEIDNYFKKQINKYAYVKTLLRGNTPTYLYDIYYPINVRKKGVEINTEKISNLFKETNCITIIGTAGSGKSTLIKHLFINSITEKFGIPILVELRYLNEYPENITEYISEIVFNNKLTENKEIFERFLKKGKFVIFLDGYDELNEKKRESVVKGIATFINKYDNNKFILTSRPYANIELFPLFHNCFLEPLDSNEIEKFIQMQLMNEEELAVRIVNSIHSSRSKKYITSFLSNPLLLTLYILAFQSNSNIPEKKYIFYRRVVQALFSEHDSKSKLGFSREKKSGLSQEEFEDVLKRFSFLSFFNKKFFFNIDYVLSTLNKIKANSNALDFDSQLFIDDLKLAISLWVEDGNELKFAHKSLQEFFAASFINSLSEEQKKSIYDKTINTLSELNEIDNFLSLCEEMDELEYTKYFLIPVIDKTIQDFTSDNQDIVISNVVSYYYNSIGWAQESDVPYHGFNSRPIRKVKEVNKLLDKITKFINDKLNEIARENSINIRSWKTYHDYVYYTYQELIYYLDLTPVPEEIILYLKANGILNIINKTILDLNSLKKEKIKFIEKSEKEKNNLIDLI